MLLATGLASTAPALADGGLEPLRAGYYLPAANQCERRGAVAYLYDGRNISDEGSVCLSDPQSMPGLFRVTCAERSSRVRTVADLSKVKRKAFRDVMIEVKGPTRLVYDGDAYERCGDL